MSMEQRQGCPERHRAWKSGISHKLFGLHYTSDLQRCWHGLGFGGNGGKGFCLFTLLLFCLCNQFYIPALGFPPSWCPSKKILSFNSWCISPSLMLCKLWLLLVFSVPNWILWVSIRICNLKLPIYCFFPCYHSHYFLYVEELLWQIVLHRFLGLSRQEDFKFAKGNVLLSCLGEGAWINHIPISFISYNSDVSSYSFH